MTLPDVLPLVAVRGQASFPSTRFTLRVGRDQSVAALREAGSQTGFVLLVAQREAAEDDPQPEDLHETGTMAEVVEIHPLPDHSLHATLRNLGRARIVEYTQTAPIYCVRVEILALPPDLGDERAEPDPLVRSVRSAFHQIAMACGGVPSDWLSEVLCIEDPGSLEAGPEKGL